MLTGLAEDWIVLGKLPQGGGPLLSLYFPGAEIGDEDILGRRNSMPKDQDELGRCRHVEWAQEKQQRNR